MNDILTVRIKKLLILNLIALAIILFAKIIVMAFSLFAFLTII